MGTEVSSRTSQNFIFKRVFLFLTKLKGEPNILYLCLSLYKTMLFTLHS